jgi:hypothetical protein
MAQAQGLYDTGVVLANIGWGQLAFTGTCTLADPGQGDHVSELTDGEATLMWQGTLADLGPMDATFSGSLAEY